MDRREAWKTFQATTGVPENLEDDYYDALEHEVDHMISFRSQVSRRDALEHAARRIYEWWQHAEEQRGTASHIVARSRKGYAWAVLAAREHAATPAT